MTVSKRRKRTLEPLPVIPIDAVLQELGADMVPTGSGWTRMSCPFHEDRTASAAVNHELNAFVCHSCGRKGDSLKLLQAELGVSFTEALNRGRALLGMEPSAAKPVRKRRASELL